jgi:CheY-like chemotaxis protein
LGRAGQRLGVHQASQPGSILLVEDDDNDVVLIQRAMRKANIANEVHVVRDGERAIEYLKGTGAYADRATSPLPMVMLLDLKLPRRSGHEVLQWVRSQPALKRLPVVVLTSSRESIDVNKAYDLGANSYLVKPVTFDGLIELVSTLDLYWLSLNESPEVGGD